MDELRGRLRGVLAFPATSFRPDLSLDLQALEKNIAEMTAFPFCAIVAPGGLGELYSLTVEESVEIVRLTVRLAAGRMAVFGCAGFNAAMGAEMARRMEKAGADALLIFPPYYANPPAEGLYQYYRAIGNSCGLPLAVYSRDWAAFSPQMVARLADLVPTLQFWKDGQGDARKYQRIMSVVGDRLVWLGGIGDDCVAAYFAIGVPAYTSSISAVAPRLCLALGEAGLARDFDRLNVLLHNFVHPLYSIRDRSRGYEVAVMKAAMEILGKPAGPVRPPLPNVAPQDLEDLRRVIDSWGDFLAL